MVKNTVYALFEKTGNINYYISIYHELIPV